MIEYVHALELPWIGAITDAARTFKRNTRGARIGPKHDAACVQLALKVCCSEDNTNTRLRMACVDTLLAEKQLACVVYGAVNEEIRPPDKNSNLGKGTYSRVYTTRIDNKDVAIKLFYDNVKSSLSTEIVREVATLRALEPHTHIVQLLSWRVGSHSTALVLPLYDGTLKQLLRSDPSVRMIDAATRDLIAGVAHCHEHKILHRDVKPENVLVKVRHEDATFALCDFNLARFFDGERTYTQNVVSVWYRCPELTVSYGPVAYATGVDDWAVGCVLYEMLFGHPAFPVHEADIGAHHLHFLTGASVKACRCSGCMSLVRLAQKKSDVKSTTSLLYMERLLKRPSERSRVLDIC